MARLIFGLAMVAAVSACMAQAEETLDKSAIEVSRAYVDGGPRKGALGPAYKVGYAVKNVSDKIVTRLVMAVVGRNSSGEIVEISEDQVFWGGSLPTGLVPGDTIITTHVMDQRNTHQIVRSIEATVSKIEFLTD